MIALDTNVLVRFLVEDDEEQTRRAARLLARTIASGESLFVSDVALCEVVWVLSAAYKFPRAEIVAAVRALLHAKHLAFSASEGLGRALEAYASSKADFADHVIGEHGRAAGCDRVATFDKALLREPGFVEP